jgi:hypothetical protein
MLNKLAAWHQTKPGLLTFAAFELAAAVLFLFWSFNGGNWIDWLCVVILVSGFTQNIVRLTRGSRA